MRPKFNMHYLPLVLLYLLLLPWANSYAAGETTRISIDSAGVEGNFASRSNSSISADGRYAAFTSKAANLVPGDTNGQLDVFVHDRLTGTTTRVSVGSKGQGNGYSYNPSISADGRYVAFTSVADNLVPWDTNVRGDVFVHDRTTGKTTRVSVGWKGQGNEFSLSGPFSISADGRYVAFNSIASNLVPGDTNEQYDVFVHDRLTGTTIRVSVDSAGGEGNAGSESYEYPAISADGRYVAFASMSDNLVPKDFGHRRDVFVRDRLTFTTTRVSVGSKGRPGNGNNDNPSISADGRYVAFSSAAVNLVPADGDTNGSTDIFVHDRTTGTTTRVSVDSAGQEGNDQSQEPFISADGRYVAFSSAADNLVPGDTNVRADAFVHNLLTGKTTRVNVDSAGLESDFGVFDYSYVPISADGRYVVFESDDSNLVPGDTNETTDIFIRDRFLNTSQSADLQLAVTSQPDSVQNGDVGHYLFTITNNGPDNADAVTLTDSVSAGKVWSLTPSKGDCSAAAVSVCRLHTLAAGESATVRTVFKAKGSPLSQSLTVNAAPVDSDPANNRVIVFTPVTP